MKKRGEISSYIIADKRQVFNFYHRTYLYRMNFDISQHYF